MLPSTGSQSLSTKRRSLFRFKIPSMSDSDGAVELTAYNGTNGESCGNGLGEILKNGGAVSASKQEIRGPTGTVRGFKNLIRDRKECLRNSIFAPTDEVRIPALFLFNSSTRLTMMLHF